MSGAANARMPGSEKTVLAPNIPVIFKKSLRFMVQSPSGKSTHIGYWSVVMDHSNRNL
jgi:hypothetical protein